MRTARHILAWTPHLAIWLAGWAVPICASGAQVDFDREIAPILSQHCAECHGPNVQKGKVSLLTRGHASGEAGWKDVLAPGHPDHSALLESVSGPDPQMPKKGAKLSEAEITKLRQWIAEGASWPAASTLKEKIQDTQSLWSLRPVTGHGLPESVVGWMTPDSAVDAFLEEKLQRLELLPAERADRRTLIRRLSYTLHGLPPAPEDVTAFLADTRPDAWERLVDRYLASPRYGERWARHWLDIAHYADTHGFERDQKREHAWPYRDWVIRAFNSDMPYDQFIQQQIAGDVTAPQDAESVIATGFLGAGPWDFVGQKETPSPVLKRQARADELDDMVTQVMTATMGLTINCARCHNHKLDPISQEDYYRVSAVFAGVTRGEREIEPRLTPELHRQRDAWRSRLDEVNREISLLSGRALDLADIVGGGDGSGKQRRETGIDPSTGKMMRQKQGFLQPVQPNTFQRVNLTGQPSYIDGVVVPDGQQDVPLTSTGLTVRDLPATSGKAWDAIRSGAVNAQASTRIDGVDYASGDHRLLGLHANAGITFNLEMMRGALGPGRLRFTATLGYGGTATRAIADFHVYVDGRLVMRRMRFGAGEGGTRLDIPLASGAKFLTLVSTDGEDGISHDQVFLGDARIAPDTESRLSAEERAVLTALLQERRVLEQSLGGLPKPEKFYGVLSSAPPPMHVLTRGNPEAPAEAVIPGALSCWPDDESAGYQDKTEGSRRKAFARWLTDPRNPLTARVLVNRLWHHHFGRGLVDTPSDFGHGGSKPSHAELLDWLADSLVKSGWSVKHLQRSILTSSVFQRRSVFSGSKGRSRHLDASNQLLSHMTARRLDAESLRDSVLFVSGCLNASMGGPGYKDFEYEEAYAPIYRHVPANRPELWRRSVYRFIVRTTPQRFMTTLDCPDPANLTPVRLTTTTALQSLALMNNAFMLQQAEHFAARIRHETASGADTERQVKRAFELAFQRSPDREELREGTALASRHGLASLCRILLNANEFVYLD